MGPRTGLNDMEKRKFLPLPGLELPTPRSSSPSVTIPTELTNLAHGAVRYQNCAMVG
jgi:hypothetical protein